MLQHLKHHLRFKIQEKEHTKAKLFLLLTEITLLASVVAINQPVDGLGGVWSCGTLHRCSMSPEFCANKLIFVVYLVCIFLFTKYPGFYKPNCSKNGNKKMKINKYFRKSSIDFPTVVPKYTYLLKTHTISRL